MTAPVSIFSGMRGSRPRPKKVAIKKGKLRSSVLPSTLPVWLSRGWTRVDDESSETAARGASTKEKN